jgi:hypothetical protein
MYICRTGAMLCNSWLIKFLLAAHGVGNHTVMRQLARDLKAEADLCIDDPLAFLAIIVSSHHSIANIINSLSIFWLDDLLLGRSAFLNEKSRYLSLKHQHLIVLTFNIDACKNW